jgi:rubrerythrin
MNDTFNAIEILEMAGEIERNGARFYRKAAEFFEDPQTKKLLMDLAEMEDQHEKVFAAMQQDFEKEQAAPVVIDPDNLSAPYLHAMAEGRVFDVRSDPVAMLSEHDSLQDILKIAINLEKESIVFYVGIKEMVPETLGKDKIDDIIREEMMHVALLGTTLADVKK